MSSTAPAKKIWTILDLISWGTNYLAEKNFEDSRLTIELMLCHVLHLKRIQLYTQFDRPLSDEELASFKEILKRRIVNEPLQYILGETEFMGYALHVDPRVLIPRPETELLVDNAVKMLKERFPDTASLSILDIGTGSGCIIISMLKLLPHAAGTAMDISGGALEVAKENAQRNGIADRIQFLKSDILQLRSDTVSREFHCILSNPPYISQDEYALLGKDVKDFEPKDALTDNANGLNFYPEIAHFAKASLFDRGIVGVEHAFDQSDAVQKIFEAEGFSGGTVIKDHSGIRRHLFYSYVNTV